MGESNELKKKCIKDATKFVIEWQLIGDIVLKCIYIFFQHHKEGMIKSCIHIIYEYNKYEHVNYEYICWYLSYE